MCSSRRAYTSISIRPKEEGDRRRVGSSLTKISGTLQSPAAAFRSCCCSPRFERRHRWIGREARGESRVSGQRRGRRNKPVTLPRYRMDAAICEDQSIFHLYVESAFRRTVITVRLKPDTTYM